MDQQRVMLRRKRDRRGTFDQVKRRAYEIYEARGGAPGHALDDWLQAECELRASFGRLESAPAVSQGSLWRADAGRLVHGDSHERSALAYPCYLPQ